MINKYKAFAAAGLLIAILALTAQAWQAATNTNHADATTPAKEEKTLYTCGMHPAVIQDHPGNCPICGMALTPIRNQTGTAIAVDPVTIQNMGIRTAVVTRGPLRRTIRTVGTVDFNETTLADVTTRFKGWIEKLHANATGQLVMRGDPLFEIYSPDLYSAQREYLLALKQATNSPGMESLRASALMKLKLFDVTDDQIAELERAGQPRRTVRVVAPQDGFVIEKSAVEGQMVEAGMKTYRLADLGLVWVQAQIYEQDLVYMKLGQEALVTLSYLPDREFRGRVTYIYPTVDEKTRTARVRMEFHNPGYFLKPGMFVTVRVESELEPSALLVPDMAILRSGEKSTVFVALDGGKFEPRTITLGPNAGNDSYQVVSGLNEGDRIVTSGQFMLDSESQLREAVQKMLSPKPSGATRTNEPGMTNHLAMGTNSMTVVKEPASGSLATVTYICPMPEHVSIGYNHSGSCPLCGMILVPVTAANLGKLQPGGKLLYYTCPLPEHGDVHAEKPGKCPRCGMTLIPVMEPPAERSARDRQP